MDFGDLEKIKDSLIDFEKRMSDHYKNSRIKAPMHLSGGNEYQLIELFREIDEGDWVFSSWRNHYHALLKGIPDERLEKEILDGRSMHVCDKNHKFFSSSLVGGHLPISLGVAMALKLKNSKNCVWAFCGDMAAETGVFHEVVKYAEGQNLPINFVVEDDGMSVYTPTRDVWKSSIFSHDGKLRAYTLESRTDEKPKRVRRYSYERKWPHHGVGLWVEFPEDKTLESIIENYQRETKRAMKSLSKDERTLFLGQTVGYKGSPMYSSLEDVAKERRIELPVMEEVQMGISTGLSFEGYIPVSIYPRFDFLILATNQFVNHLDKVKELSNGQFDPKVIIRTMVGSKRPLYPGPQHCQDHTEAYKSMLTNVDVVILEDPLDILPAYERALKSAKSTLLVEKMYD